ncbi:MAG: hypothetical protein V5A44_01325 [Haloarculaceae archaeon]
MVRDRTTYECARCGTTFRATASHTEIVRRDFVEMPRPSRIERLCSDCWGDYVGEFLGEDFEETLSGYESR